MERYCKDCGNTAHDGYHDKYGKPQCYFCYYKHLNKQNTITANNPNNEPIGPYTGRCNNCGSNQLKELDQGASVAYQCINCNKIH